MNEEFEQSVAWLEKLTRDPMHDARPGTARVIAASEPQPRPRYQECRLELHLEAPEIDVVGVTAVVFSRTRWPRVGDRLPARISATNPQTAFEVDWEHLPEHR